MSADYVDFAVLSGQLFRAGVSMKCRLAVMQIYGAARYGN